MFSNRSTYWISAGFLAVMVMLGSMISGGLVAMRSSQESLQSLVSGYTSKAGLTITMYAAVRERSVLLLHMVNLEDPFERDEVYLRFVEQATRFTVARQAFAAQIKDPDTRALHARLVQLTREGSPWQGHVADFLAAGDVEGAGDLLVAQALPAQNKVLDILLDMLNAQQQAAERAIAMQVESNRQTRMRLMLLAIAAGGIASVVAVFVVRRSSAAEDALFAGAMLSSIRDAVVATDDKGRIRYINPAAEHLIGISQDQAQLVSVEAVLKPYQPVEGDDELRRTDFQRILNETEGQGLGEKTVLRSVSGVDIAVDGSISPLRNERRKILGMVVVLRDVSEARALQAQLTYEATHDGLTGIFNRHAFEAHLQHVARFAQAAGDRHALLFIDLDQFKVVNDTCGHHAGDMLLQQVADLFGQHLRSSDRLARLGGDEFAVLIEHADLVRARSIAEKLRAAVEEYRFAWDSQSFTVGISLGVAPFGDDSLSADEAMSAADTACQAAKEAGRNRIRVFREDDDSLAQRKGEMRWVSRITEALEGDRFELWYQRLAPLSDAAGQDGEHIEVLLRMRGDDDQLISPGFFVPAAERYGQAERLDRWVIDHSLAWLSSHPDAQARIGQFGINLSGQTLGDENLAAYLAERLQHYKVPAGKICFEITETAAIANLTQARRLIGELTELGCSFALDDFGSGLSSFGYLKTLPVTFLKIDGLFVKDLLHDPIDHAMVRSINDIGHVMGKKTIGEYAENDEIIEALRRIGVDYAQGYGVTRPRPLDEMLHQR